jgi:metal transporter CNNM
MLFVLALLPVVQADEVILHILPWEDYLIYGLLSVFLVLFGGLMSGLTVGLMSIDELELEMKLASGTAAEKRQAQRVLPVVSRHHFLLVTLLLANSAAMEALPIFLDYMFSTVIAIILSVSFVLTFGEIIPQALCTGPNQLKIAAKLVPLVLTVEFLFFPISYPLSKLLDRCFGDHDTPRMNRDELKTLVSIHGSDTGGLDPQQVKFIHGAIDVKTELVEQHMIPMDRVFSLSEETKLNRSTIKEVVRRGYSRVPVYCGSDQNALMGILLVKKLLDVEPNEDLTIGSSEVELRAPIAVGPQSSILSLLSLFEDGRSHMAFVTELPEELLRHIQLSIPVPAYVRVLGVITLEDILEVTLHLNIRDESDFDRLKVSDFRLANSKRRVIGHRALPGERMNSSGGRLVRGRA